VHQRDHDVDCFDRLRRAMALTTGRRRANIAFLGARLPLQSYLTPKPNKNGEAGSLSTVEEFLHDSLAHDEGHAEAQWCLAAVRYLQGDHAAMVAQAARRPGGLADARYHYFAALCHLLGGAFDAALAACQRIAQ